MKKILITGGTGSLGQKLVEILSLQNKFDIYFTYSGSKKEAQILSEKYQAHSLQVTGLDISLIPKNFDIVVNAVGFGAFGGLTHTVDDQLMKQAFEVNLMLPFKIAKLVLPYMMKKIGVGLLTSLQFWA